MATETGPDLSFAQQTVEGLMDDTCIVVRPAVLDEDGLLGAPRVYPPAGEYGPCLVGSAQGSQQTDNAYRFTHRASLPAAAQGIQEGDVLIVQSSRRDPDLPGSRYIIRRVSEKTFLVSRRLGMERFESLRRGWHEEPEATP